MQLILAIEADRRQADQLAALVRRRLAVELVQATSAGDALQALGDRVPDLILTSPLLSPFDEFVLAEYLREIGSAGAHVQTLRIPVLSMAKPEGRSLFSFGRKRKPESAPDGCDPSFFVDEISVYLARATEERQAVEASSPPAFDVTAEADEPDVPLTYTPAYEPEPYASHNDTANGPDDEWRDRTPFYLPEAAPTPTGYEIIDVDSAPFGDQEGVDAKDFLGQSGAEALDVHPQEVATDSAPEKKSEQQEPVDYVDDPKPVMAASVDAGEDLSSPGSTPISADESTIEDEPSDVLAAVDNIALVADVGPPIVHKAVVADGVVTRAVTESSAVHPAPRQEPEPDHAVSTRAAAAPPPRRSAGFEAALAAIRNAWGAKRRTEPAPTSILFGATGSPETQSPAGSSRPAATEAQGLVAPSEEIVEDDEAQLESSGAESNGPIEVDLTKDVEALDDPVPIEMGNRHAGHDDIGPPDDEDVYELSAAALPDLESDLAAASPPRAVPQVLPEMEDEETPRAKARRRSAQDESRKSRKRSNKRPPAKPPKPNPRPVQDEWGMFDPARCGFAAVVQKLNEVTDEEEQKNSKTTVRLISFR
jgi:hypothetical protein